MFDITLTTAASTGSLDSMYLVVIPAATEITNWSAFTDGRDLVEQRGHVLRLDGDDQRVGPFRGRLRAGHLDAVRVGQGLGAVLAADGGDDAGRRDPGPEHAGQQRLAHLSRAENRDHRAEPSAGQAASRVNACLAA